MIQVGLHGSILSRSHVGQPQLERGHLRKDGPPPALGVSQGEPSQGTAGSQEHLPDTAEIGLTPSVQAPLVASVSFYRVQRAEQPSAVAGPED